MAEGATAPQANNPPVQAKEKEKDTPDPVQVNNAEDSSKKKTEPVTNGDHGSPNKTPTKLPTPKKLGTVPSPLKSPSKTKTPDTPSKSKTPETPGTSDKKKIPMNKVQVGAAPSPNLKVVKSKIGSLDNTSYRPGGGKIKIENRKLDFSKAQPRIEAKNQTYTPGGGDKKIQQQKLQWSAKPKVGSLDNAAHKPGGGEKKIESVKLDFKEKAKPKVGSKDNIKHVPGGGTVKIEDQKVDIKATSKIGSLDNVKHKPGGGEIKIFDDKEYLKQMTGIASESQSGTQDKPLLNLRSKSCDRNLSQSAIKVREPTDQNFNQILEMRPGSSTPKKTGVGNNNDTINIEAKSPTPKNPSENQKEIKNKTTIITGHNEEHNENKPNSLQKTDDPRDKINSTVVNNEKSAVTQMDNAENSNICLINKEIVNERSQNESTPNRSLSLVNNQSVK